MVVAEVPLWVAHRNEGPTTNNSSSGNAAIGSSNKISRAKDSLSLLAGLGGGSASSAQKCAVYSVDFHPNGTKFATGGGDGKVKIWNSDELFQVKTYGRDTSSVVNVTTTAATNLKRRSGPRYTDDGKFQSSGESGSSDDQGSEDDHGNTNSASMMSDDDSDSDSDVSNGNGGSVGNSNNNSNNGNSQQDEVHDLTSLVRRKKKGGEDSKSMDVSPLNKKAADATATLQNKPTDNSNNNSNTLHANGDSPSHKHRLLCTLSAHTGSSVLAVRFSPSGRYLASAGDDSVVCIYSRAKTGATGNNNLDQNQVEHWTRIKLCRGHALDVVGLAWAPDDSHLVSCSLDSNTPIIVWKLADLATQTHRVTRDNILCSPYKILGSGVHSSTVKGVTFDPAGTYLASSGDDPCICVWRAHDDWGLEKRIDSTSGIFRSWGEDNSQGLSNQTLFRRLSWSTDGSYICSTNAVVKNKHVASTISRSGWGVSGSSSSASGAANLVGHKQPVVASRHCPYLLDARKPDQMVDDGEEPEYATLLALGDRRGFLTVWSTKRARPIFKLQCSETRSTITDLAWGKVHGKDLSLIVSLLDGQIVALRFNVPGEVGAVLDDEARGKIFELRYGINPVDSNGLGGRRLFVGESSAPRLIENAFQLSMESTIQESDDLLQTARSKTSTSARAQKSASPLSTGQIKANQQVSKSHDGKKRIRPVLIGVDDDLSDDHPEQAQGEEGAGDGQNKSLNKKVRKDPLHSAIDDAEKIANDAEAMTEQRNSKLNVTGNPKEATPGPSPRNGNAGQPLQANHHAVSAFMGPAPVELPVSTDRIHSVQLPVQEEASRFVLDCTNTIQTTRGHAGNVPCTTVSLVNDGQVLWKDQMVGTSCCSVTASKQFFAVGTSDGSVQLYGTSPSVGWSSGIAFRSHPPFIYAAPIVSLQLKELVDDSSSSDVGLLVVTADGNFVVHRLLPKLGLLYKGSILSPMKHVALSSQLENGVLPKLARIQITATRRLLLLLSLNPAKRKAPGEANHPRGTPGNGVAATNAGGSVQAFVYMDDADIWIRVADGRFVLSDFYSTLPQKAKDNHPMEELAAYEDAARVGSLTSTLRGLGKKRKDATAARGGPGFNQMLDSSLSDFITRSHCEDRMACAVIIGSSSEFKHWLMLYTKNLSLNGDETHLRILVDMLIGTTSKEQAENGITNDLCWWFTPAPHILGLDRIHLVKTVVVPEMSRNRALQRLTNEISVDLDHVSSAAVAMM